MDREAALQTLQDIRREILAIHTETDLCRDIQARVSALKKEKEHPAPPAPALKPENTAEKLKRQNRERIAGSRLPETVAKIANTAVQALICLLLGLDVIGKKELIIRAELLPLLDEYDGAAMLFAVHAVLALALSLLPFVYKRVLKWKRIWLVLSSAVLVFALLGDLFMSNDIHVWTYVILTAAAAALTAAAIGTARLIRRIRVKSSALSAAQKKQWEAARAADERAKAANTEARAAAQAQWEAEQKRRMPEIDREIGGYARQFDEHRRLVDQHMQALAAMDALCEEDKSLQTVDLLIRFIETRRADSVKEALQEYDKLMTNRQLMEIEKQKLEAELRRTAQEHADRMQQLEEQRRHQAEMEYFARDTAQSRAKAAAQLDQIGAILYYDLHA